jgi:hypothetical protein
MNFGKKRKNPPCTRLYPERNSGQKSIKKKKKSGPTGFFGSDRTGPISVRPGPDRSNFFLDRTGPGRTLLIIMEKKSEKLFWIFLKTIYLLMFAELVTPGCKISVVVTTVVVVVSESSLVRFVIVRT